MNKDDTALYRFFSDDKTLLYVGLTCNLPRRMRDHNNDKPWWVSISHIELEHFATRDEAEAAEVHAIRTEQPLYNIVHSRTANVVLRDDTLSEPLRWVGAKGYQWTGRLRLTWEVSGDPISDFYTPNEISAVELYKEWRADYPDDILPISWFVESDCGAFEAAPFAELVMECWLDYYGWPHTVADNRPLQWTTLPVADKRWNDKRADKGGFIQEALHWKPSTFQTSANFRHLEAAALL